MQAFRARDRVAAVRHKHANSGDFTRFWAADSVCGPMPPTQYSPAVRSDYDLSGGGSPPPFVNRFMAGPGTGLITGGNAPFFAVTFTDPTGSFRPRLGCVTRQGQAARLAPAAQRRTRH